MLTHVGTNDIVVKAGDFEVQFRKQRPEGTGSIFIAFSTYSVTSEKIEFLTIS